MSDKPKSLTNEQVLAALRQAYGASTNKEMMLKMFEHSLQCADFCKAMGIEPDEPTLH